MKATNPILIIKHNKQLEIATRMGCDSSTVSLALKGKRKSELAEKIRKMALDEYEPIEVPLTAEQKSRI